MLLHTSLPHIHWYKIRRAAGACAPPKVGRFTELQSATAVAIQALQAGVRIAQFLASNVTSSTSAAEAVFFWPFDTSLMA